MPEIYNMTNISTARHFGEYLVAVNESFSGTIFLALIYAFAAVIFVGMARSGRAISEIFIAVGFIIGLGMLMLIVGGLTGYGSLIIPITLLLVGVVLRIAGG